MIDINRARDLVKELIDARYEHTQDDELVILDDETIEREFGWVFFYTSRRFLETGNALYMLFGNAPIIVDRRDGSLHVTGTARSVEEYIRDFESKRAIKSRQERDYKT
jgi:hypothetical protein